MENISTVPNIEEENTYREVNEVVESAVNKPNRNRIAHRICLPSMQGFIIIEVNDILYFNADHNYTVFNLVNGKKITVSKAIKDYENMLDSASFFRIHKSSIINLKYLKEFSKTKGNLAVMTDNSTIAVSRRRLPAFIKAVEEYNTRTFSL